MKTLIQAAVAVALALSGPHVSDAGADGPYETAVMSSSPAAYWRFEETNGLVLNRADTPAPAGTVSGSHQRNQPSASSSLGSCIEFSGGGVRVPFSTWTQPGTNFSVELWAKAVTVTAPAHLAGSSRDLSSGSFKFVVYGGPVTRYSIGAGRQGTTASNGADAGLSATTADYLRQWHHYVYVHDGSSGVASFYVDGELIDTSPFSMANFATNTSDFMIALHDVPGFPYPFRGMIDEVAFYQRALGANEVRQHFCASGTCCVGDLNQDSAVDGADLGILLFAWGPVTASPAADLNADGQVDGADLGVVLSHWGACP
jgi:hypothetical protein